MIILTETRTLTVDISKELDLIAFDGFTRKAADEGFSPPVVSMATPAPSSIITVVVTKKEESQ